MVNRPPSSLHQLYHQYKEDTDAVVSWLAFTGVSLGYRGLGRARTTKLEGKTHEEVNSFLKTKNNQKVREFLYLAEYLSARKPTLVVPEIISEALDRAIINRTEFTNRLSQSTTLREKESDETHKFFIDILKKIQDTLRPFRVQPTVDVSNIQPVETIVEEEIELTNLAATADVQEPTKDLNSTLVGVPASELVPGVTGSSGGKDGNDGGLKVPLVDKSLSWKALFTILILRYSCIPMSWKN
ncbi:hypothetical protein ACHAQH_009715 [Verticillium albo-atrum]